MKLNTIMKKRSDRIAGLIVGGAKRKHMENIDVANKAGVSIATYQRRIKEPMTFSLYEFYKLCDAFGLVIEIKEKEEIC